MEKAIDGMERLIQALNRKQDPLVFNKKSAEQYADVQAKLENIFAESTPADSTVLSAFEDSQKLNLSIMEEHGILQDGDYIAKPGLEGEASQAFQKAKTEFIDVQNKQAAFCRGEKIEGIAHTASDGLKKAYTEAEHAAHKLIGKASGRLGIVRTAENGWSKAFKKNVSEMNGFKSGLAPMERAKAFGRGSVVVAGAAALVDGAFRGKDSQGEDRSTAFRVMEAVAGGVVGGAALLHGRAIMR